MSNWTLNGQTAESLGVTNVTLRRSNLADGSMSFQAEGRDLDRPYLFSHLEEVTLTGPGGTRWKGPLIRRQISAAAGAESHSYTVASPWFWLEHTVYLQQWTIAGVDGGIPLGRCILGVNGIDGRLTIGQMVAAVINYAQSVGCPVQAGVIDIPALFPVEEIKGLTCSEVIRRVLRWAPDAVGWWEFTGGPAKFHGRRRSSLTTRTLRVGAAPLEGIPQIVPREDIVPSAVVIVYERVDSLDGVTKLTTISDVAPPGADGRAPFSLHFTIPLAGGAVTTLRQPVEVRSIVPPINNDQESLQYWGKILGMFGKAELHEGGKTPIMTFFDLPGGGGKLKRELASPSGFEDSVPYQLEDPADPGSQRIYLDSALPRELVGGAVTSWMSGVKAQRQIVTLKVSYTPKGTTISTVPDFMQAEMVVTDATNRIYSKADTVQFPEQPAVGLAAQMLAGLSVPHFEGSVTTLEEECSGAISLGDVLNILGGRPEWDGMKAVIQEVQEDIATGRTTFRLGPPEHLGPADFIELQRCDRRPEGSTGAKNGNAGLRGTGIYA